MAPYLGKFHTFRPASEATKQQTLVDYMDEASYGTDGPLNVTMPDGYSPLDEAWVKAFNALGFRSKTHQIHGKMIGSIHPDTKTREYSASSYYTDKVHACVLKRGGRRLPDTDSSDLDAARRIAADRAFTCFHPAGTCAMMPRELGGVVDSRLVVHGTRNVRVVDASVFPLEPPGNIQATVYAVAGKAADIIKRDASSKQV